jgi:hypothetical protein
MSGVHPNVLPNSQPVTPEDGKRFAELEAVIERGLTSFTEVGEALLEIQEKQLYRQSFANFTEYLKQRWNFSRPRGYQLINAAKAVGELSTLVDTSPENERQVRELAKIKDTDTRVKVWREAQTKHGPQPTAMQIEEMARTLGLPAPEPDVIGGPTTEEPLPTDLAPVSEAGPAPTPTSASECLPSTEFGPDRAHLVPTVLRQRSRSYIKTKIRDLWSFPELLTPAYVRRYATHELVQELDRAIGVLQRYRDDIIVSGPLGPMELDEDFNRLIDEDRRTLWEWRMEERVKSEERANQPHFPHHVLTEDESPEA